MAYDDNMKKSIYKWRENNIEKYNAYMLLSSRKWKENNRERNNKRENQRYHYNRECLRLRNMLLEI